MSLNFLKVFAENVKHIYLGLSKQIDAFVESLNLGLKGEDVEKLRNQIISSLAALQKAANGEISHMKDPELQLDSKNQILKNLNDQLQKIASLTLLIRAVDNPDFPSSKNQSYAFIKRINTLNQEMIDLLKKEYDTLTSSSPKKTA